MAREDTPRVTRTLPLDETGRSADRKVLVLHPSIFRSSDLPVSSSPSARRPRGSASRRLGPRRQPLFAHVRGERRRQDHGSVFLLMILEKRNKDADRKSTRL